MKHLVIVTDRVEYDSLWKLGKDSGQWYCAEYGDGLPALQVSLDSRTCTMFSEDRGKHTVAVEEEIRRIVPAANGTPSASRYSVLAHGSTYSALSSDQHGLDARVVKLKHGEYAYCIHSQSFVQDPNASTFDTLCASLEDCPPPVVDDLNDVKHSMDKAASTVYKSAAAICSGASVEPCSADDFRSLSRFVWTPRADRNIGSADGDIGSIATSVSKRGPEGEPTTAVVEAALRIAEDFPNRDLRPDIARIGTMLESESGVQQLCANRERACELVEWYDAITMMMYRLTEAADRWHKWTSTTE